MKNPYEILFGKIPSYTHMWVFGVCGMFIFMIVFGINLILELPGACLQDILQGKRGAMFLILNVNAFLCHKIWSSIGIFILLPHPTQLPLIPLIHQTSLLGVMLSQRPLHLGPNSFCCTTDILHTARPIEMALTNITGQTEPIEILPDTLASLLKP